MEATHSPLRRRIVALAKVLLAIGILVYLVFQAREPLSQLSEGSIQWRYLAAALPFSLLATTISFVRWHMLIRAVDIEIGLGESLGLGALGFALNFVSLGSIGGDFFKAVFLAHDHPGKRTQAIASVVADRLIGLLALLAIASCGILAAGLLKVNSEALHLLCRSIMATTAIGWLGFGVIMFMNRKMIARIRTQFERLPLSGKLWGRLFDAVEAYRTHKRVLLAAFAASVVMALSFVTTFYMISRGLPINGPSWSEHLVIVPCSSLVGAIPITPSGWGTTEWAIDRLYLTMPTGHDLREGDGFLVGIGRRATDIIVALLGLGFYLAHRRQMSQVIAEAEEAAEVESLSSP